jgi:dTDP-4-amino-4,6-dideoxygalactose transaminase
MKVPLVDLAAQEGLVAPEVLEAIGEMARDGRFILGPRVEAFERWLAAQCGREHGVGVASGTDALELSLRALGVSRGDAVVTPAFSFVAAAEAIASIGARPVFCDVDPETLNANAETVGLAAERARAAGWRVRAVVIVHLFGLCAPTEAVASVARREGCALVEDAAQALGARDARGRPAGGASDAGCFSFFPTKTLGAWGDGGGVVVPREEIAARLRRLRAHGAHAPYRHAELGRNSRLDALQAAVLLAKARHLPVWQAARDRLAAAYRVALSPFPLVLPVAPIPPGRHAWHAFVVRSPARDALLAWLNEHGVDARVYYPVPLHRQECFAPLEEPGLAASEEACRTALALPLFAAMSAGQQQYVVDVIERFFRSRHP